MSFTAQITANIDGFSKAIDRAEAEINKLQRTVQGRLDSIADSFVSIGKKTSIFSGAVAAAGVGIFKLADSAGNAAAKINNLSNVTSVSTDLLQEMKHVAVSSNSSFEGLSRGLVMFSRNLKGVSEEGDNTVKTLRSIGVSVADTSGKMRSGDDIFMDTLNILADMPAGMEKTALGMKLFGRSWEEVALIASSGSDNIKRLREEAQAMGLVISSDALKASDDFATSIEVVKTSIGTLMTKLGTELAPLLSETLLPLLQDKIVPAVSNFAERIGGVISKFNELPQKTKNIILSISGIAAAIGPALLSLGGVLKVLPLIKTAVMALTGPVGLVVAAIAGAATLIIANWDSIKEYFTSGGGAEMFNTLKSLAVDVKNEVVGAFNMIKTAVSYIWNSIGDDIVKIFGNALNTVMTAIETLVKTFRNVAQILHGIFTLDFKFALDGLKNLFVDLFNGISRIVLNSVSTISRTLAGLFDLLGLDKWASGLRSFSEKLTPTVSAITDATTQAADDQEKSVKKIIGTLSDLDGKFVFKDGGNVYELVRRTSDEITVLTNRLEGLRNGTVEVKNVHREISIVEQRVKDLKAALDTLTGGRDLSLNISNKSVVQAWQSSKLFKEMRPVITPEIDVSKIKNDMGKIYDETKVFATDIGNLLGSGITDMMSSIGQAIGEGGEVINAIGASLIQSVGRMAQQLGAQMIAFGTAGIALKKLMMNPYLAVAAGAALVALGSAASSVASKIVNSGGGASSYSGGTSSYTSSGSQVGASDYRGMYRDDWGKEVVFRIGNNELVGVLEQANKRNSRLK